MSHEVIVLYCSLYFSVTYDVHTYNLVIVNINNWNGSLCPGEIGFNCSGNNVPVIFDWEINGTVVGRYTFSGHTTFPQNFTAITDNIITMIVLHAEQASGSTISIRCSLFGQLDYLQGSSITYGFLSTFSDPYIVVPHGKFC